MSSTQSAIDLRTVLTGLACTAATSARADEAIRLRDLYNKDLGFSDYAEFRRGERVAVSGYMAPPLKAESRFLVLTNRPMAVCPFCETSAEWPDDIVAIYTRRIIDIVPFNVPIVARGTPEIGDFKDPDTDFVSRVRIAGAYFEPS